MNIIYKMSIYKNLVVESINRVSGDESDFSINVNKNFFTKPPNSIKLIDSKINVETFFINETNNYFRIEKRNSNNIILGFYDVFIEPTGSMSGPILADYLNAQILLQVPTVFLEGDLTFDYVIVTNNPLITTNATPLLDYNNKTFIPTFDYFKITITSGGIPSSNGIERNLLAINFNVANSIGNLLGYGNKLITLNSTENYFLELNNITLQVNNSCYKSTNKLINYELVNNIPLSTINNTKPYFPTYLFNNRFNIAKESKHTEIFVNILDNPVPWNPTDTNKQLIDYICSFLNNNALSNVNNLHTGLTNAYGGFGSFTGDYINTSYSVNMVSPSPVSSIIKYNIDFNFNITNSIKKIFTNFDDSYTNLPNYNFFINYSIVYESTGTDFINNGGLGTVINNTNNSFQVKGSLSKYYQTFQIPPATYMSINDVIFAMQNIVNTTYTTNPTTDIPFIPSSFPSDLYPEFAPTFFPFPENPILLYRTGTGKYTITYTPFDTSPNNYENFKINFKPALNSINKLGSLLGFRNSYIIGTVSLFLDNVVFTSDNDVLTMDGNFTNVPNQILKIGGLASQVYFSIPTNINSKELSINTTQSYNKTNDLINDINILINTTFNIPNTYNVVFYYDSEKQAYIFEEQSVPSKIFSINFDNNESIGNYIGFNKFILSGSTKYTGISTSIIENSYDNNSIYICSDLTNNIDTGCLVPSGGNFPIANVLFSIPRSIDNLITGGTFIESAGINEVFINSSKLSLNIRNNVFDSNENNQVRFYLQIPGGIGFIKKEWYMRTQISFQNIIT